MPRKRDLVRYESKTLVRNGENGRETLTIRIDIDPERGYGAVMDYCGPSASPAFARSVYFGFGSANKRRAQIMVFRFVSSIRRNHNFADLFSHPDTPGAPLMPYVTGEVPLAIPRGTVTAVPLGYRCCVRLAPSAPSFLVGADPTTAERVAEAISPRLRKFRATLSEPVILDVVLYDAEAVREHDDSVNRVAHIGPASELWLTDIVDATPARDRIERTLDIADEIDRDDVRPVFFRPVSDRVELAAAVMAAVREGLPHRRLYLGDWPYRYASRSNACLPAPAPDVATVEFLGVDPITGERRCRTEAGDPRFPVRTAFAVDSLDGLTYSTGDRVVVKYASVDPLNRPQFPLVVAVVPRSFDG